MDVREQARAEGREEGREEGETAMLVKLLTARFGALPGAVMTAVSELDPTATRELFDRAVTAPDLVTLFPDD